MIGPVHAVDVVDVHAEGEIGRVVLGSAEQVRGDTMAERLAWCREHLDGFRRFLLREPRGHPAACAVLVLPPVEPGSHFGIVVLEQGGFTPMSGSNTMCAVAAAVDAGIVEAPESGGIEIVIDTAVGTVRALAEVVDGRVRTVTVANVPSFVVELDRVLDVPEYGPVRGDIVFGGQFFFQTAVAEVGLVLEPREGRRLARAGAALRLAALEQLDVVHPEHPSVRDVSLIMLHSGHRAPNESGRNTVVLTNAPTLDRERSETWVGVLDRSPCGTGTSGRMAALHARGELAVGEAFHHLSIIGSEFVGRIEGKLDGPAGPAGPAILPTVTGRTWVAARCTLLLDPDDPFPDGFTVADIWPPL